MREYSPSYGSVGLLAATLMGMNSPFVLSDPRDDLAYIRRSLSSRQTKKPKRRISQRRATCNTHKRERAKVAAGRKANVMRLRSLSARQETRHGE